MSDIPRAREIIAEVAAELAGNGQAALSRRLMVALGELYRRPLARPKAPRSSAPVDPETARQIRRYAKLYPQASQQTIGEAFGTNHGRVAEALRGDR